MHGMRLWGMYRRQGHRAILTGKGSLVVAPTWLEATLLRTLFKTASVRDHSLSRYYGSLAAVLLNQVEAHARHEGGAEGLLQLLQDLPMTRIALREHAASKGISLAEQLASEEPVDLPAAAQRAQAQPGCAGCLPPLLTGGRSNSARADAVPEQASTTVRSSAADVVSESDTCSRDGSSSDDDGGRRTSQTWSRAERLAMLQELGLCDNAAADAADLNNAAQQSVEDDAAASSYVDSARTAQHGANDSSPQTKA